MSTKILFTFEAEDLGVAKKQDEISDRLKQIRKDIQAAKQAGSPYTDLLKDSQSLKREQDELRKRQRELNKEFAATKVPKDSLAGLRLEYSKLVDQISVLDKAQRNSTFGKSLISQAATAKQQINEMEAQVGRFTGNVGNYKLALANLGDTITGGLVTGGIGAAVLSLAGAMKVGIQEAVKYEKALDDLSALTGLQGTQLENLSNLATDLQNIQVNGAEIVNTGPDILNALKLVGGARPELLKDAEALADVTKQAIILSQASGDDLQTSVKGLTTILGQFDLQGKDSKRVINELAAGAKEGAAEIPQITDALRESGTVAKIYNVSTGQAVALTELLADKQLKGAEAGTQLRNIFAKLAAADILPRNAQRQFEKLGIDVNVLKDTTLPLEVRLKELGKAQGDLSALTKIFGLENLQAATIITSGIPKYEQLLAAIEGTNEAYKQAEIRSGNLQTQLTNLQNKGLNSLREQFDGITSSGSAIVSILGSLVSGFDLFGKKINAIQGISDLAVGPLGVLLERINAFTEFFKGGDKPTGLQGLDVNALKQNIDLLTGELKPAVEDNTDALLAQAVALQENDKAAESSAKNLSTLAKGVKNLNDEVIAGSIEFYRKQVSDLQAQLEKTPVKSPLVDSLIQKLKAAEKQLQVVDQQLKDLRNPQGVSPTEFDKANAGLAELGVSVGQESAQKAEAQLIALAESLSRAVNVQLPVEVSLDEERLNEAYYKLNAIQDENNKKKADKDKEDNKKLTEAIEQAALSSAQNIADGVFAINQNNLEREQEAEFEKLDKQEQKAIEAANGNAVKEKQIRENFEKKRAQLEKEGANKRKELAKKEAEINIALAIIKALTGAPPPFSFVLAGVAAIAGAVQLSAIESQEFWQGGQVKRLGSGKVRERQNAPRTRHGDTVLAYLAPGEMVLTEEQQGSIQSIAGKEVFARAGVPGYSGTNTPIPHFASGGIVSDIIPQTTAYSYAGANGPQVNATFTNDQVLIIARTIAGEVSTQVGSEVRIGIGVGLNDANRRLERESQLDTNRQG